MIFDDFSIKFDDFSMKSDDFSMKQGPLREDPRGEARLHVHLLQGQRAGPAGAALRGPPSRDPASVMIFDDFSMKFDDF